MPVQTKGIVANSAGLKCDEHWAGSRSNKAISAAGWPFGAENKANKYSQDAVSGLPTPNGFAILGRRMYSVFGWQPSSPDGSPCQRGLAVTARGALACAYASPYHTRAKQLARPIPASRRYRQPNSCKNFCQAMELIESLAAFPRAAEALRPRLERCH